jgi:hypothetical protein
VCGVCLHTGCCMHWVNLIHWPYSLCARGPRSYWLYMMSDIRVHLALVEAAALCVCVICGGGQDFCCCLLVDVLHSAVCSLCPTLLCPCRAVLCYLALPTCCVVLCPAGWCRRQSSKQLSCSSSSSAVSASESKRCLLLCPYADLCMTCCAVLCCAVL